MRDTIEVANLDSQVRRVLFNTSVNILQNSNKYVFQLNF